LPARFARLTHERGLLHCAPDSEEAIMYLHTPRSQKRDRNRSSRYTAKLKAKNRRRVNRMQGRRLSKAR
jgi:hypothetical protein